MAGRNGFVWGPERPQTPNFRVPWYVTLFGYICAVIGLLIFFLPIASRTAYAFEVSGEWYPDDLTGYTVTLNTHLSEPPSSLVGTFWEAGTDNADSPSSMPSGSLGRGRYIYMETQQYAGNSHPWFFSVLFNPSTSDTTLPSILGVDYWSRYGYDGYSSVRAYWGLKSGVTRPTLTFLSKQPTVHYPLYTNHDFIIWVVENSDFRSRYGGVYWEDPTVVQVGPAFSWVIAENVTDCNLYIRWSSDGNSFQNVQMYSNVSKTGTYTAQYTGYYEFAFAYPSTPGGLYDQIYLWGPSTFVSVASEVNLIIKDVEQYSNLAQDLIVWCHVSGDPVSVKLQYETSSGSWVDVPSGQFRYMKKDDSYGYGWVFQDHVKDDLSYRIVASDAQGHSVTYVLGTVDNEEYDVATYIMELASWVSAFIAVFPDLFLWMPIEVRVVLVSAIIVMIILGLVGWLKS